MDRFTLLQGNALDCLREFPTGSVQCCVTSPPYWGLRDYGTANWIGGDEACDHAASRIRQRNNLADSTNACDGGNRTQESRNDNELLIPYRELCGKCGARRVDQQIGLEPTIAEYLERMVAVFAEVRRVLRDDGTLWLNMGDCYASGKGTCLNPGGGELSLGQVRKGQGAHPLNRGKKSTLSAENLKPKDLVGMPWRVAFALQEAGWWLRSDIIWAKPNPMPESVSDRPTKSHEYLFLLTKSARYYYDHEAIKEPFTESTYKRIQQTGIDDLLGGFKQDMYEENMPGRKNRDRRLADILRATLDLALPAEYKGSLPGRKGGPGQDRRSKAPRNGSHSLANQGEAYDCGNVWAGRHEGWQETASERCGKRNRRTVWTIATEPYSEAHFATYPQKLVEPCILAGSRPGDLVLDPFLGSGTTALVALRLGRRAVGIELNPEYAEMAKRRVAPVLSQLTLDEAPPEDAQPAPPSNDEDDEGGYEWPEDGQLSDDPEDEILPENHSAQIAQPAEPTDEKPDVPPFPIGRTFKDKRGKLFTVTGEVAPDRYEVHDQNANRTLKPVQLATLLDPEKFSEIGSAAWNRREAE